MVVNDSIKICGIINEPFQGYDKTYSVIGMGLHVNNTNTTCLNALIKSDHILSRCVWVLGVNCRAFILSAYMLKFCMLLQIYRKQGFEGIAAIYLAHWENYLQEVETTISEDVTEKIRLTGITYDGYLKGEDSQHRLVELYPDRNCEDSLANLIAHILFDICKQTHANLQHPRLEVMIQSHSQRSYLSRMLRALFSQSPRSSSPSPNESFPFFSVS